MTNTIKVFILVAVLVVGFVLGTLSGYKATPAQPQELGSVTFDKANLSGGVVVGQSGTYITKIIQGTCNLVGVGSDTISGANYRQATCTAPGVVSGDKAQIDLPYISGSMVLLAGATASTTNGYITVQLYNASSTVASQVTKIGTSTSYFVTR